MKPTKILPAFTPDEWEQLEAAALRMARAHGYGSGWRSAVAHPSQAAMATEEEEEDEVHASEILSVAHRGQVVESAARRTSHTKVHVRRHHAWTTHAGIGVVPFYKPNVDDFAALSFADHTSLEENLLRVFALEDADAWIRVEGLLPLCQRIDSFGGDPAIPYRDAMARIMFRAGTAIDQRARELGVRAENYRTATRRAEWLLRSLLMSGARKYNAQRTPRSIAFGASQGNGVRKFNAWSPEENRKTKRRANERRVNFGTAKHPANDLKSRSTRISTEVPISLPVAA